MARTRATTNTTKPTPRRKGHVEQAEARRKAAFVAPEEAIGAIIRHNVGYEVPNMRGQGCNATVRQEEQLSKLIG